MAAAGKTFVARVTVDGKRRRLDVAVPKVVGVTQAAELLKVPKSNVSRLTEQGRMPSPVPQEGPGAPVWLKVEVMELAEVLQTEREQRAARRAPVEGS